MIFSDRSQKIIPSRSALFASRVIEKLAQGEKVIPLHVGESDQEIDKSIVKATNYALSTGKARYDHVAGLTPLRKKLSSFYSEKYDKEINENQVIVSNGSKQILYTLFQAILDPDDQVIIPAPYWVTFPESVTLAGGTPVILPLEKDFSLNIEQVKRKINPKTKAVIINMPNNPSGKIYKREKIKELLELAKKHDFLIISDEAYVDFDYTDFPTPAILEEGKTLKHVAVVHTFSKNFSMSGYRIGYLMGSEELVKQMVKIQSHVSGNSCTFAQHGALAALSLPLAYLENKKNIFKKRMELTYTRISTFLECKKPDGGFYLFAKLPEKLTLESFELAIKILDETGVALLPGSFFGAEGYIRICFSRDEKELMKAYDLLEDFFK